MRADAGERPGRVIVDIGRKTQFRAAGHRAREKIESLRIDEAALALAALRPGIGIKKINAREARLRQPVENERRVAAMDSNILDARLLYCRQELRHSVDEGLATDESGARFARRGVDQVLAPAKADLEPKFFDPRGEERACVERTCEIDRELREQRFDELGLMGAQRFAFRAAVQPAMREGVGHRRRIAGGLARGKLSWSRGGGFALRPFGEERSIRHSASLVKTKFSKC